MNIESNVFSRWTRWAQSFLEARVLQVRQKDIFHFELLIQSEKEMAALVLLLRPLPMAYIAQNKIGGQNETPGRFCMSLRKHLIGSRISAIEQVYGDKVIRIDFSRIEDAGKIVTRTLYAELIPTMPNLVLTQDNQIIDVLTSKDQPNRTLRPQEVYALPLHSDKMHWVDFTSLELESILAVSSDLPVRRHLFSLFHGLSQPLISDLECITQADLNQLSWSALLPSAQSSIIQKFQAWKTELDDATSIYVYRQGGEEWISSYTLRSDIPPAEVYADANEAFAVAAQQSAHGKSYKQSTLRKRVDRLIQHANRKYKKIFQEKREIADTEKMKQYGDLLAIYSYLPVSYQTSVTFDNLLLPQTQPITIPITPGKSMAANSQRYYHQYSRLKRRETIIEERLHSVAQECEYLTSLRYFLDESLMPAELDEVSDELNRAYPPARRVQPHNRPESDITFVEYDGFKIGIGKNNTQNDRLTMRLASPHDLWFHARQIPGSHVILFACNGSQFTPAAMEYAAALAAGHSRAKHDNKVEVDYTLKKYIKKPKNAPPGFVHYTHQQTISVRPQLITK